MKVRKSLFSRILKIFILMSLGTLILTMAINTFVSRIYFKSLKVSEVQPTLSAIESLVIDVENGVLDYSTLERFVFAQTLDKNTQIIISDENGNLIFSSRGIKDDRNNPNTQEAPNAPISPDNFFDFSSTDILDDVLLSNDDFVEVIKLEGSEFESMVIGQSIVDNQGNIVGAVAAIVPVYELDEAVYTLMISLAISMSAVMLVSVFILYLFSKKLTKPLINMMEVANHMSQGSFDQKADQDDPSEIGALGLSLNTMSDSLKSTLDEIQSERSKLELMLTSMKEGVISFDTEGHILVTNPAVYRLLECDKLSEIEELLNQAFIQEAIKAAQNGEFKATELMVKENTIGLSVSPIYTNESEVSGVVAVFTDQSEAKRIEKMQRDYVANVSHELRTPITAMRAFIEPLNDDLIKDETKKHEYYNLMLKEIERLNRLINDLLELSRLQNTDLAFKESKFNLRNLITDLSDRYQFLASEKQLEFNTSIDLKNDELLSNEDRVEQVLTILLDNAFKYTDKGQVNLSVYTDKKQTCIEVSDSGLGISQTDLAHIFERFYTVDKARTMKSFGLGLSIAKEIVEHLDAQISVDSQLDKGTTFTLKFNKASEK